MVGLRDLVCLAYLDDILCYGKNFEEYVVNLRKVLQRLKSKGIKLRVDKCEFCKPEVRYLGRLVSEEGYRPDPEDTKALEKFRTPPKNVGEVRSLVGFLGYYRKYVRDFAKKMKPVYDLIKTEKESVKSKQNPSLQLKSKIKSGYDKKRVVQWSSDLQKIVDNVIDTLKSPTVMAYPQFDTPFILNCDASSFGLGAVLYQQQDNKMRVISFASRTLSDAERNYHLHSGKLEFLALKWSITEKFSDYLGCGLPFTVYTDNNPLTYVMTSAKLNATGMRWVSELADYDFTIRYRPGKNGNDADGLSRNPMSIEELQLECTGIFDRDNLDTVFSSSEITCCHTVSIDQLEYTLPDVPGNPITKTELGKKQSEDSVVGPVYKSIALGDRPKKNEWSKLNRRAKLLFHQWRKLSIKDGVLVRNTQQYQQIVLPESFHPFVFSELHQKMGHLASDRVEDLARQRFYWPHMRNDIEFFIKKKCSCLVSKKPNTTEKAPLVPIKATYPFEMVSIDFLHLDKCKGGFEYVLVVCDHFTRFSQAYATKSKSSKAAADKLFNNFILQFGFPKRIHHDKGPEFNSNLFKHLHRLTGMRSSNTTPYHPMGDGQVERLNRTLINMLKAIPENEKKKWKEHLPKLLFAYNSTIHTSTGYSPFYLMFGRASRLPIDGIFPNDDIAGENETYSEFVCQWKQSMDEAFKIANDNIRKKSDYNKNKYDEKAKSVEIKIRDRVLVKNVTQKGGTGKLNSFWEQNVYEVVNKVDDLPVYEIRRTDNKKNNKIRKIHRNLLKQVNELELDVSEEMKKPTQSIQKKVSPQLKINKDEMEDNECIDSDDDLVMVKKQSGNTLSQLRQELYNDNESEQTVNNQVYEDAEERILQLEDNEEIEDVDSILGDEVPSDVESSEPEVANEDVLEKEESETEEVEVIRKSARERRPKQMFTYDKIGGKPLLRSRKIK